MWKIVIAQRAPRGWSLGRTHSFPIVVDHCATVTDAVRTAQRAYPGWTALYAERIS